MLEKYLSVLMNIFAMVAALLPGPAADAPRESTMIETQSSVRFHDLRLSNGVRLHYAEQGPATGPAVLLLHGYTDSSFSFSGVMPLMSPTVRVIAPDQRGHGKSDRPEQGFAIDDFASDALQLMDALQVPTAAVVGHSMSSFVARRMAEMRPERVSRLVLMGAAPTADNTGIHELMAAVNGLTDPVDAAFARGFQEGTVMKPVPDDFMDQAIEGSRTVPARVWKAALSGLMAYAPGPPPTCPTLVLGGDHDAVFSMAEQEALARAIPGATLDIVPGVGHALHWEDPERFVASLARFIGDKQ
jgi:non-heme chloroperoxidase